MSICTGQGFACRICFANYNVVGPTRPGTLGFMMNLGVNPIISNKICGGFRVGQTARFAAFNRINSNSIATTKNGGIFWICGSKPWLSGVCPSCHAVQRWRPLPWPPGGDVKGWIHKTNKKRWQVSYYGKFHMASLYPGKFHIASGNEDWLTPKISRFFHRKQRNLPLTFLDMVI